MKNIQILNYRHAICALTYSPTPNVYIKISEVTW